jgi:ribonucleoside-triphosphate reductase
MDTPEGVSRPAGKYIFNNINFNKYDPLLDKLRSANYKVWPNPTDAEAILVRFPVEWTDIHFPEEPESAVAQLDRYRMMMDNYVDQNCSITVSYEPHEVPGMIDWLLDNWNHYVGVSFMLRTDATKSAEDSGHPYLPQEVVDETTFRTYADTLLPVDISGSGQFDPVDDDCATGFCPVR